MSMSGEKKYLKTVLDQAMKTYSDHNDTVKRLTIHIENLWTEIDLKNERIYDLKYELDQEKEKLKECQGALTEQVDVNTAQLQKHVIKKYTRNRTDN